MAVAVAVAVCPVAQQERVGQAVVEMVVELKHPLVKMEMQTLVAVVVAVVTQPQILIMVFLEPAALA